MLDLFWKASWTVLQKKKISMQLETRLILFSNSEPPRLRDVVSHQNRNHV